MKIPGLKKGAQEKVNAALARARGAGAKFARGGQGTLMSAGTGAACFYALDFVTGKGDDGKPSYVLPISGKGLWSTIYGYLALGEDAATVRGVTFYKHGETPGLGGECENPEWCAKWVGKSILDDSKKLVGVIVKKGAVDPTIADDKRHKVDGLSGATITCNGITKFVKSDLTAFEKYLASVRK